MSVEECMRRNPQRHEFLQLTSILHLSIEENLIVGHRHLGEDEFWVRGHLPDRPLFPGVLQIETMAQVASIHAHAKLELAHDVFMGFGAVDDVRFRKEMPPGSDLWVVGRIMKANKSRPYFRWQGQILDGEGTLVSQSIITGVSL